MTHIFITGSSGALGSAIVPLFVSNADTKVTLLLRAESPEHLTERRRKLLTYLKTIGLDSSAEDRIKVVQGDISKPCLGLRDVDANSLAGSVTNLVHAAGNVKLNQSIEDARRTAVGSAQSVVDLARRCQASGQFVKLEFVSTVGVGGRMPGSIPEQPFREARTAEDFHNTYEAAKWESERYLWEQIDAGLPATIHRPSMIVGDSASGKIIHFQVFYFLTDFLLGRRTWGIVPRTGDAILDIIPVDYVAKAIHLAATDDLGAGQAWHLCSGPQKSRTLIDLIARIRELLLQRGDACPASRSISLGSFRQLLNVATHLSRGRSRRFLSGLPFLLDYLGEDQVFDNAKTNILLSNRGIEVPTVESYLETIMIPYWERTSNASRSR